MSLLIIACVVSFFLQAEGGIRDLVRSRGLGDVYKRQPQAWAALTKALYAAGFVLLNRYVVHAEHPISVHISNSRALTDDAILVLAPGTPGDGPMWPRPAAARQAGEEFTADCATLLGWLLGQPGLSAGDIERVWQTTLAPSPAVVL